MKYEVKHCIFCGEGEDLKELYPCNFKEDDLTPEVFSARRFSDRFHYKIVRCKRCGLVFSREVLPNEVLSNLYAGSKVTFGEYADIIRKDYIRPLKPYLGQMTRNSALEIGCSSGFFLEELLAQGFKEVHGCEPSIEAREKACVEVKNNIYSGFFNNSNYQSNNFDLVCSFQTLDHLSDPLGTVKVCRDILKAGGFAYFIAHDVASWQARIMKDKSPIIDVEHIYLFDKKTLRKLLEKSGFKIIKVADLKNSYPIGYWIKLLFKGNRLGMAINKLINSIGLGKIAIPIAAGNIYIIAQRKEK